MTSHVHTTKSAWSATPYTFTTFAETLEFVRKRSDGREPSKQAVGLVYKVAGHAKSSLLAETLSPRGSCERLS